MLKQASLSVAIMLGTCFAGTALAAQDGLGSSWPNKPDLSSNSRWHVYVFNQSGVRYIQVNDLNGNVREVVATANGQFLVLPMGVDMTRVSTGPDKVASTVMNASRMQAAEGSTQQVYRDKSVSITEKTDLSGNPLWSNTATNSASLDTCGPPNCGVVNQEPTGH